MTSRTPSIAEVLRSAVDARIAEVHVAVPARVESYDAARQSCSVKPLLKDFHRARDGARVVDDVPVISDVPVMFLGGNGFEVIFPIAKGDTVMLLFSERSLDVWLSKGGDVDPIDVRRHALSDAVAIPGLQSFASPRSAVTDPTIRDSTGNKIEFLGTGGVKVTGAGTTVEMKATGLALNGGTLPVARQTDAVTGTAGPYPVVAQIVGGNPLVTG